MTQQPPRFRFAPSPNGELHLGHAYSALKTWEMASRLGGEVLLRIEDIDVGRTRQRFVDGIYEDLAWLGLSWPEPVRRQSEHFDIYREAAEMLWSAGLLFCCTATRKQIAAVVEPLRDWPNDPDGTPLYPGLEMVNGTPPSSTASSKLEPGAGAALRINMAKAISVAQSDDPRGFVIATCDDSGISQERKADPAIWGDTVLVRKDTPTSYHLSVVVDDAAQNITHVTRGRDLEAATDLHVLMQRLLDVSSPVYHHHDLIADSAGRKLSKSLRDTSLRHLRESGWSSGDVRRAVGLL